MSEQHFDTDGVLITNATHHWVVEEASGFSGWVRYTEVELAEIARDKADRRAREAVWEAGAPRRAALAEIARLEASLSERMWREDSRRSMTVMNFGANDPRTGKTASQYIAWVDDRIADLRGRL